jgi:hypothetical protein
MATRAEIAWAAGLFEGEGCITEVNGSFAVKVNNTDEWVVLRLAQIMGFGFVYGPYRNSEADGHRRKRFWVWTSFEEAALDTMQILSPWLSPRRLRRAHELTGLRFPVQRLPL